MNSITITGRLLRLPEIKIYEKDGQKNYVAKYILVSRKPYATKENPVNYVYCESKGNLAIFAQKYFTVGKNIGIQGYLDIESFINADGKRKTKWVIVAERQEFLESKRVEKETLSAKMDFPFD